MEGYGYRISFHKYETDDGYVNTAFRIAKNGQNGLDTTIEDSDGEEFPLDPSFKIDCKPHKSFPKKVVILQHSILHSGLQFLLNGFSSLAFLLVDRGYDVWLNNSRGSIFSKEHQFLDLNILGSGLSEVKHQAKKYYDFSFHEMAIYDLPALWKMVLKETK